MAVSTFPASFFHLMGTKVAIVLYLFNTHVIWLPLKCQIKKRKTDYRKHSNLPNGNQNKAWIIKNVNPVNLVFAV
jgi:hypothetical protein